MNPNKLNLRETSFMSRPRRNMTAAILILFGIFCALSCLFPYTGDDWAWGSTIGLERLRIFFKDYNGRYMGNFLVLALTRSKLLDVLTKAAAFTFACWLCCRQTVKKGVEGLAFAAALFFIMPRTIFREAVVWTSGFTNYVPSALLSVAYIVYLPQLAEQGKQPTWAAAAAFVLSFAGGLFMENITIFNVLLGAAVIVWCWFRNRSCSKISLGFLAGAAAGAAVLFSNSAYQKVASGTDYYRTVARTAEDTLARILRNAAQILDHLIFENIWFCAIVTLILLFLAWGCMKKESGIKRLWIALSVFLDAAFLAVAGYEYLCAHVLSWMPGVMMLPAYIVHEFRLVFGIGYVISVAILIWLCTEKKQQYKMLLPLLCVPVSLAPMLLVEPIGPRCVFIGYLLMMVCTTALFDELWTKIERKAGLRRITCGAIAAVIALRLISCFGIYSSVHYWDRQRNAFARVQSDRGSDTVYLCTLPHEEYLHNSSPVAGNLIERYIRFHGLREEVTLAFISPEELQAMIDAEIP